MARGSRDKWTDEDRAMYDSLCMEVADSPLDYVRHDSDARLDDALRAIVMTHGVDYLGMYWVLVECLCTKKGHMYDVSDDMGLMKLALDMSTCGCMFTPDEVGDFVGVLAENGLIDGEVYEHSGRVVSERVLKECRGYAQAVAAKRVGGIVSGRSRKGGE